MSADQALFDRYVATHPDDVARHLERLETGTASALLAGLAPDHAALLVPRVSPNAAAEAIAALEPAAAAGVLDALPIEVVTQLLRRLSPERVSLLLEDMPAGRAEPIRRLLASAPGTAGAVMDPLAFVVPVSVSASEARDLAAAHPQRLYHYLYAVDAEHRLVGVLDLPQLMRAEPTTPIRRLMTDQVVWLSADATLETVFAHPGWHQFDALPVIDADRHVVGVLRHRRMRHLQAERAGHGGAEAGVGTVLALGEIYWLGLCGLLQGFAAAASTTTEPQENV